MGTMSLRKMIASVEQPETIETGTFSPVFEIWKGLKPCIFTEGDCSPSLSGVELAKRR